MDLCFYVSLIGNLGLVREAPIRDVFKGREEMVLNHNPHSCPRVGIGEIICPTIHGEKVTRECKKRNIENLYATLDTLSLSLGINASEKAKLEHQNSIRRKY